MRLLDGRPGHEGCVQVLLDVVVAVHMGRVPLARAGSQAKDAHTDLPSPGRRITPQAPLMRSTMERPRPPVSSRSVATWTGGSGEPSVTVNSTDRSMRSRVTVNGVLA